MAARVAFLGLGHMGLPMARNLQDFSGIITAIRAASTDKGLMEGT